jgi:signal peptidase I
VSKPSIRTLAVPITAVVAVAVWLVLGPSQLGGGTQYAIVNGSSMEPGLSRGDLVAVRSDGDYERGDVVLYESDRLGTHVLHRVIETRGDRYVLKGDNNDFVDPERPTSRQVVGLLWFSIPRVGTAVQWLAVPIHAALAFFVLTALAFGVGAETTRRRPPGETRPRTAPASGSERLWLADGAHAVLAGSLVAFVLFALLATIALARPTSRTAPVPNAYVQTGTLSYSADVAPSDVYPDGRVDTGETAFLQLVPALQVAFAYSLRSGEASDVRGRVSLAAVLSDGTGWSREIPIAGPLPFVGPVAHVDGVLDLTEVAAIVDGMRTSTGSGTSVFSVRLAPNVAVSGHVGTEELETSFAPEAPLLFDGISLRVDAAEDGKTSALEQSAATTGTTIVASRLALARFQVSVGDARRFSLLGLVVAGALAAFAGVLVTRRGSDPHSRTATRLGDRMISVGQAPSLDEARITELGNVDSLVTLAERYDRIVLHWRDGERDTYLVDDGSVVYRFVEQLATAPARDVADEDTLVFAAGDPLSRNPPAR